ncbi:MAG: hypothetical protein ABIP53_01665 [Candidatus Limnocylindrales bacterium]
MTTERSAGTDDRSHRDALMEQHRAARARREAAALGSDAYRDAAEEIAHIEVEIARREEPPPKAV